MFTKKKCTFLHLEAAVLQWVVTAAHSLSALVPPSVLQHLPCRILEGLMPAGKETREDVFTRERLLPLFTAVPFICDRGTEHSPAPGAR